MTGSAIRYKRVMERLLNATVRIVTLQIRQNVLTEARVEVERAVSASVRDACTAGRRIGRMRRVPAALTSW
jgi:hypothetical protein